jgi:hypothetical protein
MRAPSYPTVRFVVVASIVLTAFHFTDNTLNISDYGDRPGFITPATVVISWLAFTAVGLLAIRFYGEQRYELAEPFLLAYSLAGLISLGHFATLSPGELTTFGLASVLVDAMAGTAVLVVALWSILARRRASGDGVTEAAA